MSTQGTGATFITDMFMTLDGYGSGKEGYWGKGGPELDKRRAEAFGDPDQALVFGAGTYRLYEHFASLDIDEPTVNIIREAKKYVVSKTLEKPLKLANTTLLAGDAVDVIPQLKAESDLPLRCHGSISMNHALLAAGLVDRLEVTVFPIINGATGEDPILTDLPDIDLELVDSTLYDGRVQQLTYIPSMR